MTGITLAACGVPSSGFYRVFGAGVIHPSYWNETIPGWRNINLMGYAPHRMLPNGGVYSDRVHGAFRQGLRRGGRNISLGQVPWDAWRGPVLKFWFPLAGSIFIGLIGLALVIHRQWSHHEHMPYPIAEVAVTCIRAGPDGGIAPIFRNKAFWYAGGAVLAVHVVNIVQAFYPESIGIPLRGNLLPLWYRFEWMQKGDGIWWLGDVHLYLSAAAFVFFMRSDAALSLGICHFMWVVMTAGVYYSGMPSAQYVSYFNVPIAFLRTGSYLAMVGLLLYTGRRFFRDVVYRALAGVGGRGVPPASAWGLRVFLVCMVVATIVLDWGGLAWPFAVLLLGGMICSFVVITRMNVETGLFFVRTTFMTPRILYVLFGPKALGPRVMLAMGIPFTILGLFVRENMMPFVANGLRIWERLGQGQAGPRPGRASLGWMAGWMAVAALAALVVAAPCVLWAHYNWGSAGYEPRAGAADMHGLFDAAQGEVDRLSVAGELSQSVGYSTWERIRNIEPQRLPIKFLLVGAALVGAVGFMRLRYVWWPIHPILFLIWGTRAGGRLWASFLLGIIIKTIVVKMGGQQQALKLRPLLLGVIAGDLLGALVSMACSIGCYLATGVTWSSPYQVFPVN